MKLLTKSTGRRIAWTAVLVLANLGLAEAGQSQSVPEVATRLTITYNAPKDAAKTLAQGDVEIKVNREQSQVRSLAAAKDLPMQLLILIDDSAGGFFGTQVPALKDYVTSLPPNVEIGIGYMRNGTNQMVSSFTRDHAKAAAGVRLPLGLAGADVSPYDSLADAIKNWPEPQTPRKEVIMISSGIEGLGGGFTPDNPYVNRGIEAAQRAGVLVYCIYNPSAGTGRSFWRGTWGQNFLSQLADETGGEAYNINMGAPVSIAPFLDQISEAFRSQYVLTFDAKPENKAELRPVKVSLHQKDGDITAASKVFVRAGK